VKHYAAVHREATGTGADKWAAISAVEDTGETLAAGGDNPAKLQRADITLTHAIGRQAIAAARDQQLRWLQCHESACPTVTQLMRSRLSSHMLALQRMDGSLAYGQKQQAELLAAACAAVSAAPTTLPDAQDEVLPALLLSGSTGGSPL
jgi:hypothetical protein